MLKTLDRIPSKSPLYTMGEIDPRVGMVYVANPLPSTEG
jgi:hypothetical protein